MKDYVVRSFGLGAAVAAVPETLQAYRDVPRLVRFAFMVATARRVWRRLNPRRRAWARRAR